MNLTVVQVGMLMTQKRIILRDFKNPIFWLYILRTRKNKKILSEFSIATNNVGIVIFKL